MSDSCSCCSSRGGKGENHRLNHITEQVHVKNMHNAIYRFFYKFKFSFEKKKKKKNIVTHEVPSGDDLFAFLTVTGYAFIKNSSRNISALFAIQPLNPLFHFSVFFFIGFVIFDNQVFFFDDLIPNHIYM